MLMTMTMMKKSKGGERARPAYSMVAKDGCVFHLLDWI